MGLLDRPRRHLHRRGGARAGRHAHRAQAAVGEPGAYRDAAVQGIRDLLGLASRRANPAGPRRRGEDGHHGRHQCAAGAQGRPHAAGHHQGFPRRARDRLPGAAEDLRQAHHQARDAVSSAWSRSTSACAPTARSSSAPDLAALRSRAGARASPTASRAVAIVFMHAYRYPEHERQVAELAREMGFPQVSVSHEVSPLIKLVGRGDTTVVDAYLSPILRRYVERVAQALARMELRRARSRSRRGDLMMFMMSSGGLTAAELFQGKDAILSGPAGGVVGMAETGARGRLQAADRLRHGRHLDRRVALRRRIRARVRDRGRGRAHARADDADPHGRGRRRLDPASSTARASASARIRRAPIRARNATAAAGRSPSPTPM